MSGLLVFLVVVSVIALLCEGISKTKQAITDKHLDKYKDNLKTSLLQNSNTTIDHDKANRLLSKAIRQTNISDMEFAISIGANVNSYIDNYTMITWAICQIKDIRAYDYIHLPESSMRDDEERNKRMISVVDWLFVHGAKLDNIQTLFEKTVDYDHFQPELAEIFLKHGAKIDTNYLLHRAISYFNFNWQIVEFLLKHGANVNLKNQEGKTPLDLAENVLTDTNKYGLPLGFCADKESVEYVIDMLKSYGAQKSYQLNYRSNISNEVKNYNKFYPSEATVTISNVILNTERKNILSEVTKRKIKYLVHFTHIDNLIPILNLGFLPRNSLDKFNFKYEFNDKFRLDRMTDCTCFSIEFPNEWMLAKYQTSDSKICVIRLNIQDIIRSHPGNMYFTPYNSASRYIRDNLLLNPHTFSTVQAFKKMFPEQNPDTRHPYTRKEKNLPSYIPTHHQAEVLISDNISSNYIDAIFFKTKSAYDYFINICKYNTKQPKWLIKVDNFYFNSRDNVKWKNR